MTTRIDPKIRIVYARLWRYVVPHKFIGFIAIVGMAVTAVVQASLVYLLEPLMDDALVAQNLETVKRLTKQVRDPRAGYQQTLSVLAHAKTVAPAVLTKSSFNPGRTLRPFPRRREQLHRLSARPADVSASVAK